MIAGLVIGLIVGTCFGTLVMALFTAPRYYRPLAEQERTEPGQPHASCEAVVKARIALDEARRPR